MIETMTVKELTDDLRANGVSTSEPKVRAMIVNGLYPFAVGYRDKTTQCEIYKKLYEKWKAERSN